LKPLQILYPDKTFVWQKDKSGIFERILCDTEVIMEISYNYFPYKENEKPRINFETGAIILYLEADKNKEHYMCCGFEITDPYRKESKERNSLHFSINGSEWAISKFLPHLFNCPDDLKDKLIESIIKTNKIITDFKE